MRSILILGGGSAGWLTAAYLAQNLPQARIAVIDSPEISTISVGESMNPIAHAFHRALGIDERAFMRACDATYKIAIRFEGFRERNRVFFHPFGLPRQERRFEPDADAAYLSTHLCRRNQFDPALLTHYSYQIDAGRYGEFLRRYAMARGVVHHVQTVRKVTRSWDGALSSIEGHQADLYVDCTGFRALLLGRALEEPFDSIHEYLANDRAVAMDVPYLDKALELHPFTNCTALSAGWVWDIPLWSRRGVGYVYCSRYLSALEAECELREHLGAARVAHLPCRHLKIRHGRHRRPWVKNCVAIGLAAGFIEPLESTGIALTQQNVIDLARFIDHPERYNRRASIMFNTTVDFIQAHYVLTAREDTPYWRDIRRSTPKTASLEALLRDLAHRDDHVLDRNDVFYHASNWNCILSGMGFFGEGRGEELPAEDVGSLPSLYEHLASTVYNEEE